MRFPCEADAAGLAGRAVSNGLSRPAGGRTITGRLRQSARLSGTRLPWSKPGAVVSTGTRDANLMSACACLRNKGCMQPLSLALSAASPLSHPPCPLELCQPFPVPWCCFLLLLCRARVAGAELCGVRADQLGFASAFGYLRSGTAQL